MGEGDERGEESASDREVLRGSCVVSVTEEVEEEEEGRMLRKDDANDEVLAEEKRRSMFVGW